jgi:predicted PurR-regulated permease PerM
MGTSFRAQIDNFIVSLPQVTVQAALGLLNTLSTVLGLLVLPTWLLIVLKDGKQAVREIKARAGTSAPRLLVDRAHRDRSLRAFLQQQVTQAFLVGAAIAIVALLLDRYGVADVISARGGDDHRRVGVDSEIGPILAYIFLLIAGVGNGPTVTIIYLGSYFLVRKFVGQFVEARVATYVKEPHAAVMALLAIMLSQVGFVYAVVGAYHCHVARYLPLRVWPLERSAASGRLAAG